MLYCANCGTKLNEAASFCGECGRSIATRLEDLKEKDDLVARREGWKRWPFLALILLTVLVPSIIAWQFNKEFVFGRPVGEEYRTAMSVTALLSVLITWNYIKSFKINQYLKVAVVVFSMMPLSRLYIASCLFFLSKNGVNQKEESSALVMRTVLGAGILFAGFWSIHLIIFSVTSLLTQTNVSTDLSRIVLASLVFYFVQQRRFVLNNLTLGLLFLLGLVLYFFPII